MPQLRELQKRLNRVHQVSVRIGTEEVLVTDARGQMRPGDFVEEKLRALDLESTTSHASGEIPQFVRRPR